jgi:hypothetical protein
MQRRDQRLVDLQHRLAAGQHHEGARAAIAAPLPEASPGERGRIGEFAAAGAVCADEIGVAEGARCGLAVSLAAGPEIAAGEAAEHGRPAGVHAFALQRVIDLLDRVHGRRIGVFSPLRQGLAADLYCAARARFPAVGWPSRHFA